MVVSSVLDPNALSAEHFAEPGYQQNVEVFFRGLLTNSILLDDSSGGLQVALRDRIADLPIRHGQHLRVYFEEILKNRRRVLFKSESDFAFARSRKSVDLVSLWRQSQADSLVTSAMIAEGQLKPNGVKTEGVTLLNEYLHSGFEEKRKYFVEGVPPIDTLTPSQVEDLIARVLKYSKWVRFFDKQIGTGRNTRHFRRGIDFVLTLWTRHKHFSRLEFVEVHTCSDSDDPEEKVRTTRNILDELVRPLHGTYRLPFMLRITSRNAFHARHLQSQYAIVLFDRGFDLFTPQGVLARNILKLDNPSAPQLDEYRKLPGEEHRF